MQPEMLFCGKYIHKPDNGMSIDLIVIEGLLRCNVCTSYPLLLSYRRTI